MNIFAVLQREADWCVTKDGEVVYSGLNSREDAEMIASAKRNAWAHAAAYEFADRLRDGLPTPLGTYESNPEGPET